MVVMCCGGEGAPGGSFYRARAWPELRGGQVGRVRHGGEKSGIRGAKMEGEGRVGGGEDHGNECARQLGIRGRIQTYMEAF